MPFDITPTEPLTLAGLSRLLRHPEEWPAGFEWDYLHCRRCALGLSERAFGLSQPTTRAMMAASGMPREDAENIFIFLESPMDGDIVQPHHVADAIDSYLSSLPTAEGMAT